jgi:hypothetical protein
MFNAGFKDENDLMPFRTADTLLGVLIFKKRKK